MKHLLSILLLAFPCHLMAEWIEFSSLPNGDLYFYDDARVEKTDAKIDVWIRIRYKTSVMGASSYQSLLSLDCIEKSEITVQSTFYSDGDWDKPAMATNTNPKPKKKLDPDSAKGQLLRILCEKS